jgi:hypothetical protein
MLRDIRHVDVAPPGIVLPFGRSYLALRLMDEPPRHKYFIDSLCIVPFGADIGLRDVDAPYQT